MRKILLSFAALSIAVATNAFTLRMQNSDLGINKSITSAVDDPDFFGDKKVAVTFDASKKTVNLTFEGATLKATNAQDVFYFLGDDDFNLVEIHLSGKNYIIGDGNYSTPIRIEKSALFFTSDDPANTSLDITGKTLICQVNNNSGIQFGNSDGDQFPVKIATTSADQPVFNASGATSLELLMIYCDLEITASENNVIVDGFDMVWLYNSEIRTEGVTLKSDMSTFEKNGNPYAGNLKIVAPYGVKIGDTFMFPDKEFTPAEIKKGSVAYSKALRTLTLDAATIDGVLQVWGDNFIVYLKGSNTFTNSAASAASRIDFHGTNSVLKGDKDAYLDIYCNSKAQGIHVDDGLEIGEFARLSIYASTYGIIGNTDVSPNDVLSLTVTPIDIYSNTAAISEFEDLTISSPYLKWSNDAAEYSTTKKALIDSSDGDEIIKSAFLSYPTLLSFCAVNVNELNKDDIPVSGATGKASYNTATNTLTLDNFNAEGLEPSNAIYATKDLTISLVGENSLDATSDAIYAEGNITIEGKGSLKLKSVYSSGATLYEGKKLTICKRAYVTVEGVDAGLKGDGILDCAGAMDPEDAPTGTPAELEINNATLIAKSVNKSEYEGAIINFSEPKLTDAALTSTVPEGGSFAYKCNGTTVFAGFVKDNEYVESVTISANGPTAIANTKTADTTKKVIIDGQLYIEHNAQLFNATGTRVR